MTLISSTADHRRGRVTRGPVRDEGVPPVLRTARELGQVIGGGRHAVVSGAAPAARLEGWPAWTADVVRTAVEDGHAVGEVGDRVVAAVRVDDVVAVATGPVTNMSGDLLRLTVEVVALRARAAAREDQDWAARFLGESVARLHRHPDLPRVLAAAVQAVVPALAGTAVLHLLRADGALQAVASATAPDREAQVTALLPRLRAGTTGETPLVAALQQRELVVSSVRDFASAFPGVGADELLDPVPSSGTVRSVALVSPGGDAIGVLSGLAETPVSPVEATLWPLLGHRVGNAVRNAQAVSEDRWVNERLQSAVIPQLPSTLPGLELALRYRGAGPAGRVGGDFIDAFPSADGAFAVLGDVQGHGVEAATTAMLCRLTIRGLGSAEPDPARVTAHLDHALHDHFAGSSGHAGGFATACLAHLRPAPHDERDAAVHARIVCAGHPPPLLVGADGVVRPIHASGLVVGAFPGGSWSEVELRLRPGDALVICSDGVLDRRLGDREVAAALPRHLATTSGASADDLAAAVADLATRAVPVGEDDDCSVLVLRALTP